MGARAGAAEEIDVSREGAGAPAGVLMPYPPATHGPGAGALRLSKASAARDAFATASSADTESGNSVTISTSSVSLPPAH